MSDDINALSAPSTALPPGFNMPPGAPVPTPEDFAATNAGTGAGIGQAPAETSWWAWIAGSAAILGGFGLGYVVYRAAKAAAPYALAYHAPEVLPAYDALQRGDKTAIKDHVLKAVQEAGARQRAGV
jgi:hypothetical protein